MANEISVTAEFEVTNGTYKWFLKNFTTLIDQSTKGDHATTWIVGTSDEALVTGDLATFGYAFFRNIDTANYVEIGPTSGGAIVPFMKLKAGEWGWLRLVPGITIRGRANTNPVKVKVHILED